MKVYLLLLWVLMPIVSDASSMRIEGPKQQVRLLELFTSHGCSSCPPADEWLRGFVDHPGLWQEVIPIAWHVDYWDDLGWPDRFASSAYSQRQRNYRRAGQVNSVYTPGFVLHGKEWRGWFRGKTPDFNSRQEVGRLSLDVLSGDRVDVSFQPSAAGTDQTWTAHLALLGFGLSSSIGRGENAGRTLDEDFVVLGVSSADSDSGVWSLPWPSTRTVEPQRLAVVVWLSDQKSPAPIQAAGGWLP